MAETQNIIKIAKPSDLATLVLRGPGAYVEGKMTITRTGAGPGGKDIRVATRLRVDYNGTPLARGYRLAFGSDRISFQDQYRGLPADDAGNALFLQGMQATDIKPVETGPNGKKDHRGMYFYDATSRLIAIHTRDAKASPAAPPTDEENTVILDDAIERMQPKDRKAYFKAQLAQLEG